MGDLRVMIGEELFVSSSSDYVSSNKGLEARLGSSDIRKRLGLIVLSIMTSETTDLFTVLTSGLGNPA
jgi:hypothetical protein